MPDVTTPPGELIYMKFPFSDYPPETATARSQACHVIFYRAGEKITRSFSKREYISKARSPRLTVRPPSAQVHSYKCQRILHRKLHVSPKMGCFGQKTSGKNKKPAKVYGRLWPLFLAERLWAVIF